MTSGVAGGLVLPTALLLVVLAGAGASAEPSTPSGCQPNPGRHLVVATVPSVPGFRFRLADRVYTTGRDGRVDVPGVTCPDVGSAVAPRTTGPLGVGRTRAIFDGWYGEQTLRHRAGDGVVYAAFRQQSSVRLSFVDLAGHPVPRSTVGTVTVKGSTGAVVELPPKQDTLLLDSSRVVRFADGLVSKDILWSVQSADLDGNTVVNRGEVRFLPRRGPDVTVRLGLYRLKLRVHDAILHLGVGHQVSITAPNGTVVRVPLDRHSRADAGLLGRGGYTLRASGGLIAIGFDQPVAMSRPQDAELTVVSVVDLAIFGGTALGVAVGLLLLGRRTHRRHRAPVALPVAQEVEA